jgi:hypothetical protein
MCTIKFKQCWYSLQHEMTRTEAGMRHVKIVYDTSLKITIRSAHAGSLLKRLKHYMFKQEKYEMNTVVYVVQTARA